MSESIFICYRRHEASALAGRLYDCLTNWFPGKVFMDVENISLGHNFKERLQGVMKECGIVIALIGPGWAPRLVEHDSTRIGEDFVLSELEQAITTNLTVIPILLDGAKMPSAAELPPSIRDLQFHHALDVRTHCFSRDIAPLRAAICQQYGLRVPTALEDLMARIPGVKSIDENARDFNASVSLWAAIIACFGLLSERTYAEVFILDFLAFWTGLIGMNSKRRRHRAWVSMILATVSLIVMFYFVARQIGAHMGGP